MEAISNFLDLNEAAQFLKLKPSTLYAWVHQRKIPFRKHGSRLVFSRDELVDWSNRQAYRAISAEPVLLAAECDTEGAAL